MFRIKISSAAPSVRYRGYYKNYPVMFNAPVACCCCCSTHGLLLIQITETPTGACEPSSFFPSFSLSSGAEHECPSLEQPAKASSVEQASALMSSSSRGVSYVGETVALRRWSPCTLPAPSPSELLWTRAFREKPSAPRPSPSPEGILAPESVLAPEGASSQEKAFSRGVGGRRVK